MYSPFGIEDQQLSILARIHAKANPCITKSDNPKKALKMMFVVIANGDGGATPMEHVYNVFGDFFLRSAAMDRPPIKTQPASKSHANDQSNAHSDEYPK